MPRLKKFLNKVRKGQDVPENESQNNRKIANKTVKSDSNGNISNIRTEFSLVRNKPKIKRILSHDPHTEHILEDLVNARHAADPRLTFGGRQPSKDSLEEIFEEGSVTTHPRAIECDGNTSTLDTVSEMGLVSEIGFERDQPRSNSSHIKSRRAQRSIRANMSFQSNSSETSRTSMKDIVKVIQMMERGDKPKGFSHYTTSHKAKRPSIILEDELRSIDNVVKICASRGDAVFFPDPVTDGMRDAAPWTQSAETCTEDRLPEESRTNECVEEARIDNHDTHLREVPDDNSESTNFAKHSRSVRMDIFDSMESQNVATVAKIGLCQTSAFETCSTSDSWGQHGFENQHPIVRMRHRKVDCPNYF